MGKHKKSAGQGPTQRQLRVGELIRRALSDVLSRGEIHDPDLNRISVTVGEVRATYDLRLATVYVMPLGGVGKEDILKLLARNKGELRKLVSKKLALKYSPDLRFQLDRTFDQMEETRALFERPDVLRDLDRSDIEE